jgi:hypothetical protein
MFANCRQAQESNPPNAPLSARVASNVAAFLEMRTRHRSSASSSTFRLSKGSMNGAASKPTTSELIVYAATSALKWPGPICNSRISCGPSGIRIMKSMMCVN